MATQSRTGLCPQDVGGSERPEDPLALWPPDWYWLCKTHAVKGSAGTFYNFSTSGSEKCFRVTRTWSPPHMESPWCPSPPLHSSPEECCGSLFNVTALLNPAIHWRMFCGQENENQHAKNWKQVHSLYLLRRFWVISCPGSSVFIWNCERNERPFIFRNKMAAIQESLPTFFFFTRNKL